MKKTLTAALTASMLAAAVLAGCGQKAEAPAETTTEAAAEETTAEETTAEETTAEETEAGACPDYNRSEKNNSSCLFDKGPATLPHRAHEV